MGEVVWGQLVRGLGLWWICRSLGPGVAETLWARGRLKGGCGQDCPPSNSICQEDGDAIPPVARPDPRPDLVSALAEKVLGTAVLLPGLAVVSYPDTVS